MPTGFKPASGVHKRDISDVLAGITKTRDHQHLLWRDHRCPTRSAASTSGTSNSLNSASFIPACNAFWPNDVLVSDTGTCLRKPLPCDQINVDMKAKRLVVNGWGTPATLGCALQNQTDVVLVTGDGAWLTGE